MITSFAIFQMLCGAYIAQFSINCNPTFLIYCPTYSMPLELTFAGLTFFRRNMLYKCIHNALDPLLLSYRDNKLEVGYNDFSQKFSLKKSNATHQPLLRLIIFGTTDSCIFSNSTSQFNHIVSHKSMQTAFPSRPSIKANFLVTK